jgi:hypothetical protein
MPSVITTWARKQPAKQLALKRRAQTFGLLGLEYAGSALG